jgi:Zn-dependent protease
LGESLLLASDFDLTRIVLLTLAFILAIAVHEGNHALVATALGDDTPRRHGRLSLNPMRHVDLTGLVVFVLAGVGWGWTPVTPGNLRPDPRIGGALVAAAGPLANLMLAVVFSLPLRANLDMPPLLHQFLFMAVALNLLLFVLNLLPLPPLDGFSVLLGVLPESLAVPLKQIERYGILLILGVLLLLPMAGIDVLQLVFGPISRAFGLQGLR